MKRMTVILLFILIFPFLLRVNEKPTPLLKSSIPKNIKTKPISIIQETKIDPDEQEPLSPDYNYFLRKLRQKRLAPLKNREIINWSLKMSKTNVFL